MVGIERERQRRPHNQLKRAVQAYLAACEDHTGTLPEIRQATEAGLEFPPQSSYRSALQDTRYFKRVKRGVFKLVYLEPIGR
jgi:hypothetical protein